MAAFALPPISRVIWRSSKTIRKVRPLRSSSPAFVETGTHFAGSGAPASTTT
jgi:hypothetical protein